MKSYFFVIGCNSVELSADGIRISQESGAVSIAWPDVKVASLASEDPSQGLEFMRMAAAGQFWRLRAQPDLAIAFGEMARWARESSAALWRQGAAGPLKYDVLLIAHSRGIVQVFIEPGGPERDQLLAGLRTKLGSLWLSERQPTPVLVSASRARRPALLRFPTCLWVLGHPVCVHAYHRRNRARASAA